MQPTSLIALQVEEDLATEATHDKRHAGGVAKTVADKTVKVAARVKTDERMFYLFIYVVVGCVFAVVFWNVFIDRIEFCKYKFSRGSF